MYALATPPSWVSYNHIILLFISNEKLLNKVKSMELPQLFCNYILINPKTAIDTNEFISILSGFINDKFIFVCGIICGLHVKLIFSLSIKIHYIWNESIQSCIYMGIFCSMVYKYVIITSLCTNEELPSEC